MTLWASAALANPADLDTSFSGDGKLTTDFDSFSFDSAEAVAIQPDGKIVVAGSSDAEHSLGAFTVARYNANGTLDMTFGGGDGWVSTEFLDGNLQQAGGSANAVAIDTSVSPHRIVVAGTTAEMVSFVSGEDIAVVRYTSAGVEDSSFSSDGMAFEDFTGVDEDDPDFSYDNDEGEAVAVDGGGKVIVAGRGDPSDLGTVADIGVLRFTNTGALDGTFDGDGRATAHHGSADLGRDVALYADGRVLVAGSGFGGGGSGSNYTFDRFNANGTPDASFGGGDGELFIDQGGAEIAAGVVVQPDGKIVAAGESTYQSSQVFNVMRRNSDGTIDSGFGSNGYRTTQLNYAQDNGWEDVALQPDGKIVAAGSAVGVSDYDITIGRFTAGGAVDQTFSECDGGEPYDLGGSDSGESVAIQSNGRIIAVGFTEQNFGLVRIIGGSGPVPDCKAPNTTIIGPKRTRKRRPSYVLRSTEAGSKFRCRINGRGTSKPFNPCTSPFKMPRLPLGPTRFEVRAIDKAGNADPSPAFLKIKRIRRR